MPQPVVISDADRLESGFRAAHNDTARAVPVTGTLQSDLKRIQFKNLNGDDLFYIDLDPIALVDDIPPEGGGTGENPNGSATTTNEGVVFLGDDAKPADLESEFKVVSFAALGRQLDEKFQNQTTNGLPEILKNNNLAPDEEATIKGLKITEYTPVENPTIYAVLELQPDGTYCLMGTENAGGSTTIDPPTVPLGISDQQYIANDPTFTVQFPAFGGATRHVFSAPPPGMVRNEPDRVISGASAKIGQTKVIYTGINAGGETSVEIIFTGIPQPVAKQITDVYWADNGAGSNLSLYLFGSAEPEGIHFQILDPDDDSVIVSERPLNYDPGKYDRAGLFTGFAPYTALVLGLTPGTTYRFKGWPVGTTNYVIEDFEYVASEKGKIFPATSDILAFKPATASSNNSDASKANDGDTGTFYLSTATLEQAIQFDMLRSYQLSEIDLNTGDGTVNFWVIGYSASTVLPATTASLYTALNTPGKVFGLSYAGPFGSGLYTIGEADGLVGKTVRYLRVQKADSSALKLQIQAHGTPVANTPPNVVTPIAAQVLTEGDSWTLDVRPNFADANLDLLTYTVKRRGDDGVFDEDIYDWMPFSAGVFVSDAVEYEGSSGTSKVDTFRVFASDGQAQVSGDFTLTINKKAIVPAGIVRAAVRFDRNNSYLTGLLQLDSGVATMQIIGVSLSYPAGTPAKGMATGAYSYDSIAYNRQAVGFSGGTVGATYKARFTVPNGVFEANFTIQPGTSNPLIPLFPFPGDPGADASITNVYIDDARMASEKKTTARAEATELVQFQLKKAADGTIIYNFTDGAIPSGKSYYELVSNTVLEAGAGYIVTARIKDTPSILKTYAFTVPAPATPQILKIGIAPNSIVDGICRSVNVYAQVTTGAIQEAVYLDPDTFYTMGTGTYPQDYNRSANHGGAPNTGIEFETARQFKFRILGSSDIITLSYARNGDAIGTIRQLYPVQSADSPPQNYTILAEPSTVDYRVRHAGGKAFWRQVINRDSGYHLIQWNSAGQKLIDDTTEHEVEIGEDITLYGFHTRSTTGNDLHLQDNGAGDPYGSWITRRTLTIVRTSSERL